MLQQDSAYIGHVNEQVRGRIKTYILHKLGAPVVKVELTADMIDTAISVAIENFTQWTPGAEVTKIFHTIPGQTRYDIPTAIGTNNYLFIRNVLYSRFITQNAVGDFINNFLGAGLYPEWGFGFISTYGSNMTDYVIQTMYNEMFIRTLGLEGQWDVFGDELRLSPTPVAGEQVAITYVAIPNDKMLRRLEWVREWALAEAKEILGRIRGKYNGLPGPRQAPVKLDGDQLLRESAAMKAELLKRRDEYIEPFGFVTG